MTPSTKALLYTTAIVIGFLLFIAFILIPSGYFYRDDVSRMYYNGTLLDL